MERPRVPALVAVALLSSPPFVSVGEAQPEVRPPPAFVEAYGSVYAGGFDIEAVRAGEFQHPYYPTVSIKDFDWISSPVRKLSWWIRVEELRFLIPLIASERPEDHALARMYFDGWQAAHIPGARPNRGAWGEPMTVARRGMVLVYWSFREAASATPDAALLELLTGEIDLHAAFLRTRFDRDSNHGLEEAIGFHELTRITGNLEDRALALDRLTSISESSVSVGGIQREHSPGYHFLMLQSLDRYSGYLAGLDTTPREAILRIDAVRLRLRTGGYYLYDHGGRVLQMGDTDSLHVGADVAIEGVGLPAVLFDPDGGVAIYKGRDADRRYVALSITSVKPPMPRHHHNDVLAVFFSYDGETLLGGSGAYEYAKSQYRRFFVGATAHSRVFHRSESRNPRGLVLGRRPWSRDVEGGAQFGVRMGDINCTFRRTVEVAPLGEGIVVVDTLRGPRPRATDTTDTDPHIIVWQMGPDIQSARIDDSRTIHMVTILGRRYQIDTAVVGSDRWTAHIVSGSIRPVQGWYSPLPRVKRSRPVAIITVPHEGRDVIVTTGIEPVR